MNVHHRAEYEMRRNSASFVTVPAEGGTASNSAPIDQPKRLPLVDWSIYNLAAPRWVGPLSLSILAGAILSCYLSSH